MNKQQETGLPGAMVAARMLAAREISSLELMDCLIDRIQRDNPSINAIVTSDLDCARQSAKAADKARASGDKRLLLGVPMTVKESFNVIGMRTTWGIPAFQDHFPSSDSCAVGRLKEAGAIIFGKTNVSAGLADWQCENPVYGVTAHPADRARTPGGSSGGGAAALAAGLTFLELGSDSVGSIRVPAHFCGVCGHRPTPGIIPTAGYGLPGKVSLSDFTVVGPMARTMDDLLLSVDALTTRGRGESTASIVLPRVTPASLSDYRVLLVDTHPLARTSRTVMETIGMLTDRLAKAGAKVCTLHAELPDLAETARIFTSQMMAQNVSRLPEAQYRWEMARAKRVVPVADYWLSVGRSAVSGTLRNWFNDAESRAVIAQQWWDVFKQWDIVVCPASPTEAFIHDPRPSWERHLDVDGAVCSYLDHIAWISPASLAGLPSTTIPVGRSSSGMPIGLQCMSGAWADYTSLAFARHVEQLIGEAGGWHAAS